MARRDASVDLLANVPLFSACSRKELQQLAKLAQDIHVEAGHVVVREGAAGAEFFAIVAGEADVTRHGKLVATLGPGAFFGDLALLDKAPRNATVTARTSMDLIVLGQREFGSILDDSPAFVRKLLVGLAHRLRESDLQDS
jgi:CRP/FNR family transcriptional regulator, cyclic AMP receptor protein